MRRLALGIILALTALPLWAEEPMSGAEFEAYTTGKTLLYATEGGEPYGGEDYLPGRKVRWSLLDDQCVDGFWYEAGDEICFAYDDGTGPSCWRFYARPGGLVAYLSGDAAQVLYQTGEAEKPLKCLAPDLGM